MAGAVLEQVMVQDGTVIVHGLGEAVAALAEGQAGGQAVVLLSAPGAALHAGCGWWRALVAAARAEYPDVPCTDILDCADGSGQAMAALRIGVTRLVLWPDAPGRDAVVAIAESMGGFVLPTPPPAGRPPGGRTAIRPAPAGNRQSRASATVTTPGHQVKCNGDEQTLPARGPASCA